MNFFFLTSWSSKMRLVENDGSSTQFKDETCLEWCWSSMQAELVRLKKINNGQTSLWLWKIKFIVKLFAPCFTSSNLDFREEMVTLIDDSAEGWEFLCAWYDLKRCLSYWKSRLVKWTGNAPPKYSSSCIDSYSLSTSSLDLWGLPNFCLILFRGLAWSRSQIWIFSYSSLVNVDGVSLVLSSSFMPQIGW